MDFTEETTPQSENTDKADLPYTSFHSEKKLQTHLYKHLQEYQGYTKEMYIARATELLCSEIDNQRVLGFTDKSGFIYRYDVQENDFAIGHFQGSISTLYKPPRGLEYYEEQRTRNQ